MESRIARLELALQGKQAASNALPGQLSDCGDGRFNFGIETSVHEASSSDDDDAMTMVPIATASRDQPDMNDKRQARLDSVLQRKREAQTRKDEVEAEVQACSPASATPSRNASGIPPSPSRLRTEDSISRVAGLAEVWVRAKASPWNSMRRSSTTTSALMPHEPPSIKHRLTVPAP